MKKNLGLADRIFRILAALVIASLYFLNIISGTAAIIFLSLAGIFIATSFVSFCLISGRSEYQHVKKLIEYEFYY